LDEFAETQTNYELLTGSKASDTNPLASLSLVVAVGRSLYTRLPSEE
jgi:hypothetical protein